jgi:hypothetical protein
MSAQDTLWILPGTYIQGNDTMPALRSEGQPTWSGYNAVVDRPENASSSVVVVNTDSVAHTWSTNAPDANTVDLPAGTSTSVMLPSLPQGSYQYFLNDERGKVLGGRIAPHWLGYRNAVLLESSRMATLHDDALCSRRIHRLVSSLCSPSLHHQRTGVSFDRR